MRSTIWTTLRWRLGVLRESLRRVLDGLRGIERRCEGCRRVLDDELHTYSDVEGCELCAACWASLTVTTGGLWQVDDYPEPTS